MKKYKIAVIGVGYVGLALSLGLASKGYEINCYDNNYEKIRKLLSGESYIYEENFNEALVANKNKLNFSSKLQQSDMYFICVNTPSLKSGKCDISRIFNAVDVIMRIDKKSPIIIKSTCEVGTSRKIQKYVNKNNGKNPVIFSPEFLSQGTAYKNMLTPDRIIFGGNDVQTLNELKIIFSNFTNNVLIMNWESAEIVKYTANALLATKIAAINEIANLCEKTGAAIKDVSFAVGLDDRIGEKFLNAGCGFGGSCFEKDIKALLYLSKKLKSNLKIFNSTLKANSYQRLVVVQKLKANFDNLKGKSIAVLGLAFKENTNDARESVGLYVVNELIKNLAEVRLYDPEAVNSFINEYEIKFKYKLDKKMFFNNIKQTIKNVDVCIILTSWEQIKNLTDKDIDEANPNMLIIDGRNCLKLTKNVIKIGG